MPIRRRALPIVALASATLVMLGCATGVANATICSSGQKTFTSTGAEQCYTVPSGVTRLAVVAIGAHGGTGVSLAGKASGGGGSDGVRVSATLVVSPGETLYAEVGGAGGAGVSGGGGGGGFNGGGSGLEKGGGGGGASDLRTVSCSTSCPGSEASLDSRVLTAAGGGGGGGVFEYDNGGAGGGLGSEPFGHAGSTGAGSGVAGGGGGGATSSGGGSGGLAASGCGGMSFASAGKSGELGVGGNAGGPGDQGGGGGGGVWGGGGGGGGCDGGGGGGGGGSSSGPTGASFTQDESGTPSLTITPLSEPGVLITAPVSGGVYALGEVVPTSFICIESTGGPGLASCVDSSGSGPTSGHLNTSTSGPHSYTVTATSTDGLTGTATINYTVTAAPPAVSGTVASAAATLTKVQGQSGPASLPTVGSARESAPRWRELTSSSSPGKRSSRKLPLGTTFSFSLNVPASVTLTFTQPLGGRMSGGACVAQTRTNSSRKRCTRTMVAATLSVHAHAGSNTVSFSGVIAGHRRLRPGSYMVTLSATTAASPQPAPATLHFTIAP